MKKIFLLSFVLAFVLMLGTVANAAEPDVLVNFTTKAGFDAYVTALDEDVAQKNDMNLYCTYEYKDGYSRFTSKNGGDVWLTAQIKLAVSEYKFIAIKYRASGKIAGNNLYSKDDGGNGGYSAKDKTWVGPGFTADNTWQVRIINVATELSGAQGNITGLRLPIVDAKDGTFDLAYIAAFKTEAEAKAYQGPAAQEPNTETGVISFLPSLVVTCVTALGVTKKRKW